MNQLPDGMLHTLEHTMLPSMESTAKLFASHYRRVDADWSYPEHTHPLFEINLVLEGEQRIRLQGMDYRMLPGDLMIISPNQVHDSRVGAEGPMSYFCLHFDIDDKSFRQMLMRSKPFYVADAKLTGMIRPALNKLLGLCRQEEASFLTQRMQTLSSVFDLFSSLGEMLSSEEEASSEMSGHTLQIAAEIAACIEKGILGRQPGVDDADEAADPLLLADIAGQLGYSTSYCNRVFHLVYGMSPRQYISSMKLRQAKLLLLDHQLSIEQIAARLGYREISHFSRQFKRWSGMAPSHYRQNYASRVYGGDLG